MTRSEAGSHEFEVFAHHLLRYGLVVILFWIGAMKFTAHEAEGIKPLVETSPFLSWMFRIFDLQTVSNIFEVTEIAAGLMIALGPVLPRLAVFASTIAVLMFLTTLSFLVSLPGWEPSLGGFLKPSGYSGKTPFNGPEPGSNGLAFDPQ